MTTTSTTSTITEEADVTSSGSCSSCSIENLANIPLFMKDLPKNIEENDSLMALQAIQAESTPLERALVSKSNGNESYMQATLPSSITNDESNVMRLKEAIGFYSSGILVLEDQEMVGETATLKGVLHLNRSAAYLSLKAFRSANKDAKMARKLLPPLFSKTNANNSKSIKALHRQTKSALALRLDDGEVESLIKELRDLYYPTTSVDVDSLTPPPPPFMLECEAEYSQYQKELSDRKSKEAEETEKKTRILNALHHHQPSLTHISYCQGLDHSFFSALNATEQLDRMGTVRIDGGDGGGERVWPLLLLSPSTGTIDTVEACSENCSLDDLIAFVQYDQMHPEWNVYCVGKDSQTLWFGSSSSLGGSSSSSSRRRLLTLASVVQNPSIISSVERGIIHLYLIPSTDCKAIKEFEERYQCCRPL